MGFVNLEADICSGRFCADEAVSGLLAFSFVCCPPSVAEPGCWRPIEARAFLWWSVFTIEGFHSRSVGQSEEQLSNRAFQIQY